MKLKSLAWAFSALLSIGAAQAQTWPIQPSLTGKEILPLSYPNTLGPIYTTPVQLKNYILGFAGSPLQANGANATAAALSAIAAQAGLTLSATLGTNYNIVIGSGGAGGNLTTASAATIIGYGAGKTTQATQSSVFVGFLAGENEACTGPGVCSNTFIGSYAGEGRPLPAAAWVALTPYVASQAVLNGGKTYTQITGGCTSGNSGGPTGTGVNITDGNCVWDYYPGNLTGAANTALGEGAGLNLSGAAADNTLLGGSAGVNITSGTSNVAVGKFTGSAIATSTQNVAIGDTALYGGGTAVLSNNGNVAIGYQAAYALSGNSSQNTAIGYAATNLAGAGVSNSTSLGGSAMLNAGAGATNSTVIGAQAGENIGTGIDQVFVGLGAGLGSGGAPLSGPLNTAVGFEAGLSLQGGAGRNAFFGQLSGSSVTTGTHNLLLGPGVASTTLATGSDNILIGTENSCDAAADDSNVFKVCAQSGATPLLSGDLTASTLSLTVNGTVKFGNAASFTATVALCGSLTSSTGCLVIKDNAGNTVYAPLYGTL